MKKLLIILVLLIITGLIFIFYPTNQIINRDAKNNIPLNQEQVNQDSNNPQSANNQQQDAQTTDGSSGFLDMDGGGGGGGVGGAGSGSESTNSESECEETQISYSLQNFLKNTTCISFDGLDCIEKTSFCSLLVTNLDENITGTFSINFEHYELGNQSNIIQNDLQTFALSPDQGETFTSSIMIQSRGENGNANKEITCTFSSEEIPAKILCA